MTGAGPARTRLQAAARRGLTRFVGRDAELEQLRRAQQLAGSGHGQVAAIVGEAGVGKSRLVYEFTHSHRLQGWLVLESASVSYGKATSYLPVIDLLKGYFKIQDRDDLREIREKVTGKLLTLDRTLEPTLPALLALLDVPVDDAAWQTLDPAQRRQRTLDAVKRLLLREAREQPLLLIFEDLHWIDGETQALLDGLVESLGSARLLLLVNYRPEYQHAWGSKTYYSQLRLDALPAESAGELLDALLGDDPGLAPLKQLLVKRGNPFFLEETRPDAGGDEGAGRGARPVSADATGPGDPGPGHGPGDAGGAHRPAPPGGQAPAAGRLRRRQGRAVRAAPGDRRAPGRGAPSRARPLCRRPSSSTRPGSFPDLEYSFKHALTHEVTYGGLLQERRRELHARIVDAIETLHRDRLAEDIERLAHHALGGELREKAATYLRQAGRKAAARSAHQDARAWFEQALRALKQLPESPDVLAETIDAQLDLRIALIPLRRYRDALNLMREAEVLATKLGDRARLGWVLADMSARLRNVLGEHRQAIEVGRRALTIATERGDHALELEATYRIGQAYFAIGDYHQAIDLLSRSKRSAVERQDQGPPFRLFASWSHAWLAMAFSNLGRFVDAISHATEAVRIAERADHPFTLVEALTALGGVSLAKGDLDHAIGALERGLALSREWNFQPWATISRLGYAYALSARLPDARRLLEEVARSETTVSSMGVGRSIQVAWLGEVYALDQQLDDALERAQEALALAQNHEEHGHEAWAHRLLGQIALGRRDLPDARAAEDHFRRALTLATELEMRPLMAHCHLGLGNFYRRTGQCEQAREYLSTAATMYREMDIGSWLEQAEAEMRQLG